MKDNRREIQFLYYKLTYVNNIGRTLEFGFDLSERNVLAKLKLNKVLTTVNNFNGAVGVHLGDIYNHDKKTFS